MASGRVEATCNRKRYQSPAGHGKEHESSGM